MKKRKISVLLLLIIFNCLFFSGVSSLADDALKAGMKVFVRIFGDDAAKMAAKYGDDVVSLFGKYGDEGVKLLSKYGDDVAKIATKYGDDGIKAISKYGDDAIKLYGKYGDDALKSVIKHGDDGIALVNKYGDDMAKFLTKSDVAINLVKKSPDEYLKISKAFSNDTVKMGTVFEAANSVSNKSAFLEKAAHYGTRAFDYIKDNPKFFAGLTLTAAFAKAITDPEIAEKVTKPVLSATFAKNSPITIVIALGILGLFSIFIVPKIYKGIHTVKKEIHNKEQDDEENNNKK